MVRRKGKAHFYKYQADLVFKYSLYGSQKREGPLL